MTEQQVTHAEADLRLISERRGLYETIIAGKPIGSKVRVTDVDTSETVFVLPEEEGTLVTQDFQGGLRLAGRVLQLRSLETEAHLPDGTTTPTMTEAPEPEGMGIFFEIRPTSSVGLARVLARDRTVRRQALIWRQEHGDPIKGLEELGARLIGDSAEDIEAWRAVIDEPY